MYSVKLYSVDGTLKRSFAVDSAYKFYKRIRELIKSGASLISRENKSAELSLTEEY